MTGAKARFGTTLLLFLLLVLSASESTSNTMGLSKYNDIQDARPSSASAAEIGIFQSSNYTNFGSIVINSDSELSQFITQNGFSGNGTAESPYIISGLNISGIRMSNTRKHVAISDSMISGTLSDIGYWAFISFYNVSNIYISRNIIALPDDQNFTAKGIDVSQSSNLELDGNILRNIGEAISLFDSHNISISNCEIYALYTAIRITNTYNSQVTNTTLLSYGSYGSSAITISNSEDITILNASINNSFRSLQLLVVNKIRVIGFTATIAENVFSGVQDIIFIEVSGANNTLLSNLEIKDDRPYSTDPEEWRKSTGIFAHDGFLNNFTVTNSTFEGVRKSVEMARNRGNDVRFVDTLFSNVMLALGIWFNYADFGDILVSGCTFVNISEWESVRIDQEGYPSIHNITITQNLFLTPTTRRVEIMAQNIQDILVYRNNFFTRYGQSSPARDLWYFYSSVNIRISENYYADMMGIDSDGDGYFDDPYLSGIYTDLKPAIKPWPSPSFPFIYQEPDFQSPTGYTFFKKGERLRIIWYHAVDTYGTNYYYNLLWKNVDTKEEGIITENITTNYFDWNLASASPGKYYLILQVANPANGSEEPVSQIHSSYFFIEETYSSGQETEPTNDYYDVSDTSSDNSTVPTLPIPLGSMEVLMIMAQTLFLIPIIVRYKK